MARLMHASLAGLALGVGLAGCGPHPGGGSRLPASGQPSTPSAEHEARINAPPDEAALLAIPERAEVEIKAAKDARRADQLEEKWTARWCSAVRGVTQFRNWTGTVSRVEDGGLEINLGGMTFVFAPLDRSSDLYPDMAEIQEGQAVRLSGALDHDSLTCGLSSEVGGGVDNDYQARLSAIAPL